MNTLHLPSGMEIKAGRSSILAANLRSLNLHITHRYSLLVAAPSRKPHIEQDALWMQVTGT
jgi:hypothetical protein